MRPTVVIADAIAESGVAALAEHCHVEVAIGLGRPWLEERIWDAAALMVRSVTTVDRELIEAESGLKVIGRAGIGVNNIGVAARPPKGECSWSTLAPPTLFQPPNTPCRFCTARPPTWPAATRHCVPERGIGADSRKSS